MKIPGIHQWILAQVDRTIDHGSPPGPVLLLLLRFDREAARYYLDRRELDRRLAADLDSFLAGEPSGTKQMTSDRCRAHVPERPRQYWRLPTTVACCALLLGLTFAFNVYVGQRYATHKPDSTSVALLNDPVGPVTPNAIAPTDETSVATSESVGNRSSLKRDLGMILLVPERELLAVSFGQALGPGSDDSHAISEPVPIQLVVREFVESNPLTEYFVDRYVTPVFFSP